MCTHTIHVESTVHKLEHKADVGLFLCITFSSDSLQGQCTLSDLENRGCFVPPCFTTHKFNPAKSHATCCGDQSLSSTRERSRKNGKVHEKLSLQHVPASCTCDMSPTVCSELYDPR